MVSDPPDQAADYGSGTWRKAPKSLSQGHEKDWHSTHILFISPCAQAWTVSSGKKKHPSHQQMTITCSASFQLWWGCISFKKRSTITILLKLGKFAASQIKCLYTITHLKWLPKSWGMSLHFTQLFSIGCKALAFCVKACFSELSPCASQLGNPLHNPHH